MSSVSRWRCRFCSTTGSSSRISALGDRFLCHESNCNPSSHVFRNPARSRVYSVRPGYSGLAASSSAAAACTRSAVPSASVYLAFDGPVGLPRLGVGQHLDDELGHPVEVVGAEAAGGQRRGAEPDAAGVPGAVGVGGDGVAVGDDAGVQQRGLGLPAGQPERRHVQQHEVVVGAAGDQSRTALEEPVGERLGVVGDRCA